MPPSNRALYWIPPPQNLGFIVFHYLAEIIIVIENYGIAAYFVLLTYSEQNQTSVILIDCVLHCIIKIVINWEGKMFKKKIKFPFLTFF